MRADQRADLILGLRLVIDNTNEETARLYALMKSTSRIGKRSVYERAWKENVAMGKRLTELLREIQSDE